LRSKQPASLFLGIASLVLMTASAFASANVDCSINDRYIAFEIEAIAGRAGPINQINVGNIEIKPAAMKLAVPTMKVERANLLQQWIQDGDLRLQIEVDDEAAKQNVNLVILARLNSKTDKYSGRYVLKVSRDGATKEFKGRIKECVAG
jgi:hypothetical protein